MPTPPAFEIQFTVSLDRKKLAAFTFNVLFHTYPCKYISSIGIIEHRTPIVNILLFGIEFSE